MTPAHRSPVQVFANFSAGGVPAGITEGVLVNFFEKHTKFPLSDLVDGGHSQSIGSPIGSALFARHPNNENKPLISGEESHAMVIANSQIWLRQNINYLQQHLRSSRFQFLKAADCRGLYLDERIVEKSLGDFFGSMTLENMRKSFSIAAHNISANSPDQTAIIFGKMINVHGVTSYTHQPDIKIADLLRGSMAVPGHYKSKYIQDIGHLSDFAHIYTGDRAFLRFQRSRPAGAPMHFIEFGAPRHHGFTAEKADRCSLLGMIMNAHLVRGTSNHSYSNGIQIIRDAIGEDNVHNLTPVIDMNIFDRKPKPSENILDASTQNIRMIEAFVQDYIEANRDQFERLADFLGENKLAKDQAPADLPPALARAPSIKKPHFGILAGMWSFVFGSGRKPAPAFH